MMQPNFLPAVNARKLGIVFGQVFLMQSNSPMYYLTKFMKEGTKNLPILVFRQKKITGVSCNQIIQILVLIAKI
jgi:hypothetical protein